MSTTEKEATGRSSRGRQTENTAPTGGGTEETAGGKSKVCLKKKNLE